MVAWHALCQSVQYEALSRPSSPENAGAIAVAACRAHAFGHRQVPAAPCSLIMATAKPESTSSLLHWQPYLVALLFLVMAPPCDCVFAELGRGTAYLTYYPSVVLAAFFGGYLPAC
jgi:hypothetical protein